MTISDPPTQAEVQALCDKCEELADDVRNLSTASIHLALRTPAPALKPSVISRANDRRT